MTAAARVFVGVVFLFSGALKLRDPGWPEAARSLRAPNAAIPLVAPFEIVVGATMAAGFGGPVPAVGALVMLLAFTIVLLMALRGATRPVCACFGAWSPSPISWASVGRNLVLAFLALVATGSLT
jgi:uncharacterized membrane protein YphA (DoxX/SURF4 family)